MKVRAIKVIRSATISGHHIHKPGELGELLSTSTDITGRKIHTIVWEDGERCVVLPADIEAVELIAPAATDSSAMPSEAASSSPLVRHRTEHADLSGQEPVGTLPHFHFDFEPSWAASLWWEMGGEG